MALARLWAGLSLLLSLLRPGEAVRCYTDLDKTKSLSVECGLNTACVKIFKKSAGFDDVGQFIPLHKRVSDVAMFRGCFLVRLPDTCYESLSNRLTYCWCSDSDLCNSAKTLSVHFCHIIIIFISTVISKLSLSFGDFLL